MREQVMDIIVRIKFYYRKEEEDDILVMLDNSSRRSIFIKNIKKKGDNASQKMKTPFIQGSNVENKLNRREKDHS